MNHPVAPIRVLAAGAALAFASQAGAVVVGGIDFGALPGAHIETGTYAQTYVDAVGQNSTAYGLIGTVNGSSTYCAGGAPDCALYYVSVSTVTNLSGSDIWLGGTNFAIYYAASAPINLLAQSSAANLAFITGLTPWATFGGEAGVDPSAAGLVSDQAALLRLVGASVGVGGAGLLSVRSGDGIGNAAVESFFDANSIPTFTGAFADVAYTYSASNLVLNPFDSVASCKTGSPQPLDYCFQGSADLRGATTPVPEPASVALFAVGAGLLIALRRRSASMRPDLRQRAAA